MLGMLTDDAFFCDAFWQERCRGPGLEDYFRRFLEQEYHIYEMVDGPVEFDGGLAYAYAAYDGEGPSPRRKVHDGVELFVVEGGRIAGIIDYYAILNPWHLITIQRSMRSRNGGTRSVGSGLPAVHASRYKDRIEALFDRQKPYLDPNLTLSDVAEELACPVQHLAGVISSEFELSFRSLIDRYRTAHAKDLLLEAPDDPNLLHRVSIDAGFRSFERFDQAFRRFVGESPALYRRKRRKD